MPAVSIIIPTYNRSGYLDRAIKSALSQVDIDFEIIISDNCSDDDTSKVVARYLATDKIVYHRHNRNIGMVPNWKYAIFQLAKADWFVLMSDDDYFIDENYLHDALNGMEIHKNIKFVYGGGYVRDELKNTIREIKFPFEGLVSGLEIFKSRGTILPQDMMLCNMVFKVEDANSYGFLEEPNNLSCDSEFYLKLSLDGDAYVINRPVSIYTLHGDNLVKKIRKNKLFLDKNLNHVINPYIYAKSKNIDRQVINEFRRNSKMDRQIMISLLLLELNDQFAYIDLRSRLMLIIPQELNQIETSFFYKITRYFSVKLRRILLKWVSLSDSGH